MLNWNRIWLWAWRWFFYAPCRIHMPIFYANAYVAYTHCVQQHFDWFLWLFIWYTYLIKYVDTYLCVYKKLFEYANTANTAKESTIFFLLYILYIPTYIFNFLNSFLLCLLHFFLITCKFWKDSQRKNEWIYTLLYVANCIVRRMCAIKYLTLEILNKLQICIKKIIANTSAKLSKNLF